MDQDVLKGVVVDILKYIPHRPFLCLPMSAALYAILRDNLNVESTLVTGDLSYKGELIFKQDFSITSVEDGSLKDWAGHAWVEIEDLICDLSFFRTIYSDKFTKPFKQTLINDFGEGRGCFITSRAQMNLWGLSYNTVEYLSDDVATGIIKGFKSILKPDTLD